MQIQDNAFDLVLFDLDGTLVDTAPDMVAALQEMQSDHGYDPVAYDLGRSNVSNGAMGLLRIGFPDIDEDGRRLLIGEYVERYAERLCDLSTVFAGVDTLLDRLDDTGCPWGVVTNKPEYLTNPLLEQLGLAERSVCAISGDTLPVRKPEPEPLLLGCDIAGVDALRSIYIGDAARDIEAGQRAGAATIAAAYGYITEDDDPREWGADIIAIDTEELTQIVLKAVNLSP
ncbi:MAG: HAD-IA family hydrolase [Gammaproteobacteria bacterium]|nr:HAD-IA family hydrolase [Gammaproteobacteria bacterium]NNC57454.1 HAD-IA family hydrolase [Woeseiaceae bacterium]NNL49195.1 HAD-IA family hydrolase [Woeseiaceae bacterium]